MGCRGPKEWDIRVICSPLSAVYVLPLLSPIPVLQSAASVFPVWPYRLIVSWQCNGNSGLAVGGGISFPSPGLQLSRSRTLRAEMDGLSCLVGALEVFPSTLRAHCIQAIIPA